MIRCQQVLPTLDSGNARVSMRVPLVGYLLMLFLTSGDVALAETPYAFTRPVVDLLLEYRKENEYRNSPQIGARWEDTDTFWQRLELTSQGWLYDPDFIKFNISLQPEWKQQDLTATSDYSRKDDNRFLGYFLHAHVLRQKAHSLKLYLRNSRNEFTSSLSHDNVTDTEIARAIWLIDSALLPTSCHWITTIESWCTRDCCEFVADMRYQALRHCCSNRPDNPNVA